MIAEQFPFSSNPICERKPRTYVDGIFFTCPCTICPLRALEAVPVEPYVAVGELLDELHQPGHHRVEPVGLHLGVHELENGEE